MTIFRSEEHAERWVKANQFERGEIVPLDVVWDLAKGWYVDPRQPGWRPRTSKESQAALTAAGLVGDFWKLTDSHIHG